MAILLTPYQTASIASGVYKLQTTTMGQLLETLEPLGCEGLFEVGEQSRFKGSSGALRMKTETGFGYFAAGKPNTPFADDLLIATRGTLGAKTGPDWFSNYNVGLQLGPGGLPVHAGFNEIWKTFRKQLQEFLQGRRPRRIHCVGHSLGGALATLNADFITAGHMADVSLYTFGAPRVGDAVFTRSLTKRLGAGHIQRVFHPSDPVPMIPLFPFWHMPFGEPGLQISSGLGGLLNADAHSMENSYRTCMAQFSNWGDLRSAVARRADEAAQVKSWLEGAAQGRGSFLMGSASLLSMIGRALGWLLKSTGKLMLNAVGASLVSQVTVLDHLAWALTTGARVYKEVADYLKTLIKAIWGYLGRKTVQVADVTMAFMRWVLELLFSSVRNLASRALSFLG